MYGFRWTIWLTLSATSVVADVARPADLPIAILPVFKKPPTTLPQHCEKSQYSTSSFRYKTRSWWNDDISIVVNITNNNFP